MTRKNPMVEENDEKDLVVGDGPKDWAAGIPGVLHSMKPAIEHMGLNRTRKTVLAMNQKDGFDCPSCAWPDPNHRKAFEFCENGAKAVTWEATPVVIAPEFWAEHSVSELRSRSEYWLGMQGRLTEPVHKPAGEDHYKPVSWDGGVPDHRGQAQGPGLPRRGCLLHQRPHLQRGGVPLPAVGPRLRHQQPAGLLQHVPRILGLGHGPDHRHRQGHRQLRRLRQGGPDHRHGPEPGHQPPAHADRTRGVQGKRRRDRRHQSAARGRPAPVQEPAEGQGHRRPRHGDRGPVPADPDRRRHGAAAGHLQAGARRRGRATREPSWTTRSSPSTARAWTSSGNTSACWTRTRSWRRPACGPRKSTNSPPAT